MRRRINGLRIILLSVILILFCNCINVFADDTGRLFPYPSTKYEEPYRGQFHFSSMGGWMNDVNGVWYDQETGLYHLTYQHYPYGLNWDSMHWGHATSKDLLHWTQQPVALIPNGNVPGDCFSGSAVVDVNNTSGFKTGTSDVVVAIYTATQKGTCLAYSNNNGQTWQNYDGNPVNVGTPDTEFRDPHVFWYKPTKEWILVQYENGSTFYSSPDLKQWTKLSNIKFGYECPDFYQLPVDGDLNNQKWVLQDGSGKYLIGNFDGKQFTPDKGKAGGPFKMDYGPNFYAAQTFFRPTMPDNRLIQMAWMTGGSNTTPWTNSATLPVELKLVTTQDGIRLTRTPIDISGLYQSTSSKTWKSKTIHRGENILSGINSKAFDIEAVFDLTDASAKTILFQVANMKIYYNLKKQQLLGHSLKPINNQIKVRILCDWNGLEIYGNDGVLSYTKSAGDDLLPNDSRVAIIPDGNVHLVSGKFNEINSIWSPNALTPTIVDDADGGMVYKKLGLLPSTILHFTIGVVTRETAVTLHTHSRALKYLGMV